MAEFHLHGYQFRTITKNGLMEETITPLKEGEVCEYLLHLVFEEEVSPSKYVVTWQESRVDVTGFWSPMSGASRSITADWGAKKTMSRTACGMPLAVLFGGEDYNRLAIALSDTATPALLSAGTIEENGNLKLEIHFFTSLTSKMKEYNAVIRIDRRRNVHFATAVKDVRRWWTDRGLTCAHIPNDARLPMYSTWYSYHQQVFAQDIVEECKLAKPLGMDTVIVDDGWQTDDNNRGYAYCGDWQVATGKIPDMAKFVSDLHATGMKVILWYSVPFVGEKSENYHHFQGKYLFYMPHMQAYVLDPRFREVREFLVNTYVNAVITYGLDGLKLDFIDCFRLAEESPQNTEDMDTVSVEEGVEKLLAEVTEKLRAINPEIMIEFRQPYVGPIVAKYGNMFRVGDCPSDPIQNRISTLDLRLTAGTSCVHSDMIMWHSDETSEGAAMQLYGILFSVPQISVRIATLPEEQKQLLTHFLEFWKAHRNTLLDGELTVGDVQANYSFATAKSDTECITALYLQKVVTCDDTLPHYIFNATGTHGIYLETNTPKHYEMLDTCGRPIGDGCLPAGITYLPVPRGGSVKLN